MKEEGKIAQLPLQLSLAEVGIIRSLLYFDIFKYPLTKAELLRLHPYAECDETGIDQAIESLKKLRAVQQDGDFYQLTGNCPYSDRRKLGNALADERMEDARRRSRFVAKFPFVQSVMISGSLSKHYMEDGSDIDFFIITQPGRLWVARTLLIAYKKLFLLNSHKDFCMNYFIDSDNLEIEDKNIFTATEIMFLLPMANSMLYHRFREVNAWADVYYPQYGLRDLRDCQPLPTGGLRSVLMRLLKGRFGDWLDTRFMRMTMGRWRKKFPHFTAAQMEVAMRSRRYVSKHHPSQFQERVLSKLQTRLAELEEYLGFKLPIQLADRP